MNKLALLPLSLLIAAPAVNAQCTITAPGTLQPFFQDGWSPLLPIGFSFPFNNGGPYNSFFFSDHGVIALANTGATPPPGAQQVWDPGAQPNTIGSLGGFPANGGGFAGFGKDVICAYWGDNIIGPAATDGVYVDNTNGSHLSVTWLNNIPFGPGGAVNEFTAQVKLFPDGRVVINLDNRCDNTSSTFDPVTTVIGIAANGVAIPASSTFNPGPTVSAGDTVYQQFNGPGPFGTNTPDPNFNLGNSTIEFLPTNPGWLVQWGTLECAAKSTYGAGCDGLALDSNLPVIGANWDLTTSGVSPISPIAITFFGAVSIPGGLPVTFIGINSPGCSAYVDSLLGSLSATATAGTAVLTIALPLNASLKGADLFAQSLGLTLSFPSFLAFSNGLSATIGY